MLKGRQDGIWALFERTILVSWVAPARDQAARDRVARDIESATSSLKAMLPGQSGPDGGEASWFVHEGRISGGKAAREGWRALFAEAQLGWRHAATQNGGNKS